MADDSDDSSDMEPWLIAVIVISVIAGILLLGWGIPKFTERVTGVKKTADPDDYEPLQ